MRISFWVKVSVSNRPVSLVLAVLLSESCESTTSLMAGSWARRSVRRRRIGVIVAGQTAVDGLPEQRD